jgi:hypothetical protein
MGWVGLGNWRSAPSQGMSRPPHAASRDCRTAHPLPVRTWARHVLSRAADESGWPGSADCEQKLSPGHPLAAANPCAPASENRQRRTSQATAGEKLRKCNPVPVAEPTRSAACRDGMAGWAGEGEGRFGERSEDEAPTLPRLSHPAPTAQRGSPHTRQPRNVSPVTTKPRPEAPTSPPPPSPMTA